MAANPAVIELVIVAAYVPLPLFVVPLTCWFGSLDAKLTVSSVRGWPWASATVAVAVLVELPFAAIEPGESVTLTVVGGPAVWVKVAWPEAKPSVAVMLAVPMVVELVIVAVYVPLWPFVVALTCSFGSLEAKTTGSFVRGCPCASATVAVAVLVEPPSAAIELGKSVTTGVPAGPAVWIRVARPEAEPAVAVIVAGPTVTELVMVAVYVPSWLSLTVPTAWPELPVNVTAAPATR